MYTYKAKLVRVISGDTIDVMLDLGFSIFKELRVKLYNVDTYNIRNLNEDEKSLGIEAKRVTEEFCTKCMDVDGYLIIKSYKSSESPVGTGGFGRWYAEVVCKSSGKYLSEVLNKSHLIKV